VSTGGVTSTSLPNNWSSRGSVSFIMEILSMYLYLASGGKPSAYEDKPCINSYPLLLDLSACKWRILKIAQFRSRDENTLYSLKTNPCNFILKRLLQYTELLQYNGKGEFRKFSTEGWLAICRVCICK